VVGRLAFSGELSPSTPEFEAKILLLAQHFFSSVRGAV
jgi:hypothetical protein